MGFRGLVNKLIIELAERMDVEEEAFVMDETTVRAVHFRRRWRRGLDEGDLGKGQDSSLSTTFLLLKGWSSPSENTEESKDEGKKLYQADDERSTRTVIFDRDCVKNNRIKY